MANCFTYLYSCCRVDVFVLCIFLLRLVLSMTCDCGISWQKSMCAVLHSSDFAYCVIGYLRGLVIYPRFVCLYFDDKMWSVFSNCLISWL